MDTMKPLEGTDMRIAGESDRLAALKKAKQVHQATTKAKIDATAQDFEAQFVSQMMENMFSTVEIDQSMGAGEGEEIYRSLLVNEYGKLIARTGGIGVADHVKREMIRMQEMESR